MLHLLPTLTSLSGAVQAPYARISHLSLNIPLIYPSPSPVFQVPEHDLHRPPVRLHLLQPRRLHHHHVQQVHPRRSSHPERPAHHERQGRDQVRSSGDSGEDADGAVALAENVRGLSIPFSFGLRMCTDRVPALDRSSLHPANDTYGEFPASGLIDVSYLSLSLSFSRSERIDAPPSADLLEPKQPGDEALPAAQQRYDRQRSLGSVASSEKKLDGLLIACDVLLFLRRRGRRHLAGPILPRRGTLPHLPKRILGLLLFVSPFALSFTILNCS